MTNPCVSGARVHPESDCASCGCLPPGCVVDGSASFSGRLSHFCERGLLFPRSRCAGFVREPGSDDGVGMVYDVKGGHKAGRS